MAKSSRKRNSIGRKLQRALNQLTFQPGISIDRKIMFIEQGQRTEFEGILSHFAIDIWQTGETADHIIYQLSPPN